MAARKVDPQEFAKWLSVKDAHEELGRSRQGVRDMLGTGELRGVKTRIGWLIDPASVRAVRLRMEDDAERERKAKTEAPIRRASQTREVGA